MISGREMRLAVLRADYSLRCQLLDEFGNITDDYNDAPDHRQPLTLHDRPRTMSYRDRGMKFLSSI